jgi:hypothetical protein
VNITEIVAHKLFTRHRSQHTAHCAIAFCKRLQVLLRTWLNSASAAFASKVIGHVRFGAHALIAL